MNIDVFSYVLDKCFHLFCSFLMLFVVLALTATESSFASNT